MLGNLSVHPQAKANSVHTRGFRHMQVLSGESIHKENCKNAFPLLEQQPGLVYLDSAATTQKPAIVLQALNDFYTQVNANPNRGVYELSVAATQAYDNSRDVVAGFIGALPEEIVFVRNATEGINLVMHSWAKNNVKRGDIILLTEMEHHSNLVPWQQLAEEKGAILEFIPITSEGLLDMVTAQRLIAKKPVFVSFTHVSNVLGTINPVVELGQMAHAVGAKVLLDACQSVAHIAVNVRLLDVDFLVFSGHKLYGPTGIGVVFVKKELHTQLNPFLLGGDMIQEVKWQSSSFAEMPRLLEAGTPAIAEAIGLAKAIEFVQSIGWSEIQAHEKELVKECLAGMQNINGIFILGPVSSEQRSGLIAFNLGDMHSHDVASVLDDYEVCIRSGHHCCMPLHEKLGVTASCRVSFGVYNTMKDVAAFLDALKKACEVFGLEQ